MIINLDLFSPLAAFESIDPWRKKYFAYSFVGYFVNLKFIYILYLYNSWLNLKCCQFILKS